MGLFNILKYIIPLIHALGVVTAIDALYWSRSSQGAIAWCVSLITFPYLALPAYWVFGRRLFKGYGELQGEFSKLHKSVFNEKYRKYFGQSLVAPPLEESVKKVFETIAGQQFSSGNQVQLLIDGEATFAAILSAVANAKNYILIQFYIIRDDKIGKSIKEALLEKAAKGVRVYFLYDEVGSEALDQKYLDDLTAVGVCVHAFETQRGRGNFFQLNFRNHRRIVMVDGSTAFVGGLNIGDEYVDNTKRFGHWRDTHVQLSGPAVLPIQATFCADWFWAARTEALVSWDNAVATGTQQVLPIAFGPNDENEGCLLFVLEAIRSARRRIWMASPYFVPDDAIVQELRLAALRGVDVRILLPKKPDHVVVWLASFFYVPQVCSFGVRVFRYTAGFHHQKVILVDDNFSAIGTVNLDNRSLRLNFEIMLVVADQAFNCAVDEMLQQDFGQSSEESLKVFSELPFGLRLGAKLARLFAPVL